MDGQGLRTIHEHEVVTGASNEALAALGARVEASEGAGASAAAAAAQEAASAQVAAAAQEAASAQAAAGGERARPGPGEELPSPQGKEPCRMHAGVRMGWLWCRCSSLRALHACMQAQVHATHAHAHANGACIFY